MYNFSNNLKALRAKLNLNQDEFANYLQIKRTSYANYEAGITEPKVDFLIKLHTMYKIDLNEFLTGVFDASKLEFTAPQKNVQKVKGNNNITVQSAKIKVNTVGDDVEEVIESLKIIAKRLKKSPK